VIKVKIHFMNFKQHKIVCYPCSTTTNRSFRYASPYLWNQLILHSVNLILFTPGLPCLANPPHCGRCLHYHAFIILQYFTGFTQDLKLILSFLHRLLVPLFGLPSRNLDYARPNLLCIGVFILISFIFLFFDYL